jgi:hypothetical protein
MLMASSQQSSEPSPETLKADPDHRLFGRMGRRRLEAERRIGLELLAGGDREAAWKAYCQFLMDIDHTRLTDRHSGGDSNLTDEFRNVVTPNLAEDEAPADPQHDRIRV